MGTPHDIAVPLTVSEYLAGRLPQAMLHQSPDGEIVKVLDFGIAKLMGEEPQAGCPRRG